ncbi:MAG: serine/threonine-protein phosphatase [Deltaproteobacteria bacterium]|nr:serine/threonine-protein phosphatase [Deltaproteobacteria bacterium]
MEVVTSLGPARLRVAGRSDLGRRRKRNEDFLFLRPKLGLFLVADGVAGRNAGQMASQLASYSINHFFEGTRQGYWPDATWPGRSSPVSSPEERLDSAIRKANQDVHAAAITHPKHEQMSTTMVVAYLDGSEGMLHLGHAGDSRAYLIRGGAIEQLTRDHTLRNKARAEQPQLTPEQVARLPRNVLTSALGVSTQVQVDLRSVAVMPGDIFLLCSDGLTKMVDDARLVQAVMLRDEPRDMCDYLISLANVAGGRDNITVAVLRFDPM